LNEIIQFFGGATLLISAIAWLIRSITVHLLSKDIEIFKQTLKVESDRELALLKSSLELENEKVRIKLSGLEVRRIEVLEELHIKFTEFSIRASNFTYDPEMRDKNELVEIADEFIGEYYKFYNYFRNVSIFLPKSLEDSISKLHDAHFNVAIDIGNSSTDNIEVILNTINDNVSKIRYETSDINRIISKEFRELLGVNS